MIKFVFKIRINPLMAKAKYRYNPHTLSYDKIELTLRRKVLKSLTFLGAGLVIGVIIYGITYSFIDSPKEKQLKRDSWYF